MIYTQRYYFISNTLTTKICSSKIKTHFITFSLFKERNKHTDLAHPILDLKAMNRIKQNFVE